MVHIFTFGGLRIERDGCPQQLPTQKARELVAYLVAFRDRRHPRSVLVGALWPDIPEEKARRHLSDTLWRARSVLGDYIAAEEGFISFNVALPFWLDVEEFERAVTGDRRAGPAGPQATASVADPHSLAAAVELYLGPFLDGFYSDWILLEQERLRGLYVDALAHLLQWHKQVGDYTAALRAAQQLVAAEPLYEAAHRELMRLYHLLGRDTEAIAQYQRCREILGQELAVAPAPETERLHRVLLGRVAAQSEAPAVHLPTLARRVAYELDQLPLAGRDTERAALLGYLEAAAAGQGNLVLLEGEAGIGKSRLAREVVAGARWRNIGAALVRASESTASSYALFLALLYPLLTPLRLRQLARLVEPAHLQAAAPFLPAIAHALPDLPTLPDLPSPQAHKRIQHALVALLWGLGRIAPHVCVLEDLQWADAETLSLLPLLLPDVGQSRILFLLTGRSADLRADPAVWNTLQTLDQAGPFPRCTLTRLGTDTVGLMVRDLLGEENPDLTERLARESEGVPLYLVETLKAWRDEGYLRPTERGAWNWQGGIPPGLPPHFGEAVIGYRLSRLSPEASPLLDAAAVIGSEVDPDLLARVCAAADTFTGQAPSELSLLAVTDELLRLGLLVETQSGYRFSHECVRQAVYDRLAPAERRHLHYRTASALEILWPEQFELLAHHYQAAGERQRAIQCLTRAAERDRGLYAHQAALACYGRLLDLLTGVEDRPARHDVLDRRAEVLGWVGDRDAQGRTLEEMLGLAQVLGDEARVARTLHLRSEWRRLQGHYGLAVEDAQAALEICRRLGDDRARAGLLSQIGHSMIFTDTCSQAAAYFHEALSIYRALGDPTGQIDCLSGLISAAELAGDYSLALSHLQENLRLAEATGNPMRLGRVLHNLGVVYHDLGDQENAEVCLRRALALKETVGDRHSQALTHFYLGMVATERGELEAAQAHLDTALEVLREVQDLSWEGDALAALGRLALLRGDPVAAVVHLQAAYQRRCEMGEPGYAVVDLSYIALARLRLGDKIAAWEHSREAVAELEAGLSGIEHPQCVYYNHFCVAEATHHWTAARAALEKAARVVMERAEHIADPALRAKFLIETRSNRAITESLRTLPPAGCLRVRLASTDVPAHRSPAPEEMVALIWTVDAGCPDADAERQMGKLALRHHRLVRLLAEAEAAGAVPTVADLAGTLDVSSRTIRADLAALRRQGHSARTRGHGP